MNEMDRVRTLSKLAKELNRQGQADEQLPAAFFFTDDARTPDPVAVIRQLPKGTGVIFRHYAAPNRKQLADDLAAQCRRLDLPLLIAGDWQLAALVKANGVHLPEHQISRAIEIRNSDPRLLISCACHSETSLLKAQNAGVDLAFLSPLFPTKSHPDAREMGTCRIAALNQSVDIPVYGLGGISIETVKHLRGTGIAGVGAIEGLMEQ